RSLRAERSSLSDCGAVRDCRVAALLAMTASPVIASAAKQSPAAEWRYGRLVMTHRYGIQLSHKRRGVWQGLKQPGAAATNGSIGRHRPEGRTEHVRIGLSR